MAHNQYIPALRFHWLSNIYDWLISKFMPEKKFKTQLIKNADIQNNYKILDFGTGTATLSIMAYESKPDAKYTGIDIDDKILLIANKKISAKKAKIELIKYDGGQLPFSDNTFDRIITSLVIHHLTTKQKTEVFKEFRRILKPDGELHIADWGKAANLLMRFLFHIVQLLDGYKRTNDNVKGLLPMFLSDAGFHFVTSTHHFNTMFGTIQLLKSKK